MTTINYKQKPLNALQDRAANAKDYKEKAAADAQIVAVMGAPVSKRRG